jgi:hypothetical protein
MTILPQLERDLFQAAKERLPASDPKHGGWDPKRQPQSVPTTRRSGLRRRTVAVATALPVLLAVAVTVTVVVLALALFHPGRHIRASSVPASAPATRQQLVQMLGVLRRPQTKSDLDPKLTPSIVRLELSARGSRRPQPGLKRVLAQWGYPMLDRSLVRVVRIPDWHAKVGIEPTTSRRSRSSAQRSEGVDLELWIGSQPTIPPSIDEETGAPLGSVVTVRDHGLGLTAGVRRRNLLDGVVLVPDGVARVTLHVIRVLASPVRVNPSEFGTATAAVHDNIAAFQLSLPTVTSREVISGWFDTSAVAQATWFDAGGGVIKHTTTNFPVEVKIEGPRRTLLPPRRGRR